MKKVAWSEQVRADVHRLDRETTMRIFAALERFAETGEGDIKKLKGQSGELRLRVDDFRVRFSAGPADTLRIHSVHHCQEACR